MFPREKFPWMKAKYEPKYVRVHKIVLGQELLAEWPSGPFRGNPESTTLELLAELWGKGTYKVELMSAATDDHGIYRIFQNTIEVEEGDDDLPFPGPDRSAKVLAEDGEEGDDDDDDNGNDGGQSFFTGGRSPGGHMRPGMQQPGMPGMPGMPPHPGMQPGMPGMPLQPGMPSSGMRHGMHGGYPPYGYPPYAYGGYPPPQPQPEPTKLVDYAPLVVALGTIVTGITAAIITSSEKRETAAAQATQAAQAAQTAAAQQQQQFLIAMLGRNEQQTEKVLNLANAKPAVDPVMIETMANIKAELAHIRAEKSRGGGNPNEMEAIDKYLTLFDKIGDRVASRGGGDEDTMDKILGNLPVILTLIQAARGGQVPALPQQAAPQQQPAPDQGSSAGYPAPGYPSQ